MDIKKIPKIKQAFSDSNKQSNFSSLANQRLLEISEQTAHPKNNFNLLPLPEKRIKPKKGRFKVIKICAILLAIFLASFLTFSSVFIYKINSLGKKINPSSTHEISFIRTVSDLATQNYLELKSDKNKINILLLGIAGEKKPGRNLTDTIIVMSIDKETNRIALLSLPRDVYVEIPEIKTASKINSVYQIGLSNNPENSTEYVKKTVEEITSLKINYYAILNFEGFEKIIDALGGINIMNERDIYDPRYPGDNYSYETFELKKGFHNLDGKTSLKYVRERHNDPEGDFGRAKRQQQVMQAAKNKLFSVKTLFNIFALNKIFNALGDNIKTDVEPQEFESFIELSKKLDTQNINNVVVDAWNKESLLKVAHVPMGSGNAFVLVPKIGNYSEIQETAQNIFNLNEIKRRKEEIGRENARVLLVNLSGDSELPPKVKRMLTEHLNYKNLEEAYLPNAVKEEKTFVYDMSAKSKPFTLDELIKMLPAYLSPFNQKYETYANSTRNHPDIIIGLGKDLVQKYNVEEGTIEEWQKAEEAF